MFFSLAILKDVKICFLPFGWCERLNQNNLLESLDWKVVWVYVNQCKEQINEHFYGLLSGNITHFVTLLSTHTLFESFYV